MSSILDGLTPSTLLKSERVQQQFVKQHAAIHKITEEEAKYFMDAEIGYFYGYLMEPKTELMQCTVLSLYSAFMEIAIKGLSIEKTGKAEAYIEKRNVKVGENQWEKRAAFIVQAYGELTLRIKAGQIKNAFNPVVVYENDVFKPLTNEQGKLYVQYEAEVPRTSHKIKGVYIRLLLANGESDYKWLLEEDIERLRLSSAKNLKNKDGNALYASGVDGQIDTGFLEAKCIKHAFRSYPKLRLGLAMFEEEPEATNFVDNNQTQQPETEKPQIKNDIPDDGTF